MTYMFEGATSFNSDISGWDVSKVKFMTNMFGGASSFSNHDLSGWNVGLVTEYGGFTNSSTGLGNTEPNWSAP